MAVLQEFRTNAEWNAIYRSRQDGLRRQLTFEHTLAAALAEQERLRIEKDQALSEVEKLRAALLRAGLDPDR